jgi:hypothetical protein
VGAARHSCTMLCLLAVDIFSLSILVLENKYKKSDKKKAVSIMNHFKYIMEVSDWWFAVSCTLVSSGAMKILVIDFHCLSPLPAPIFVQEMW